MTPRPFPILFIAPSRIGDAVLASGLVKTLCDKIPGACFTFAGSEFTAPLFAETPGVEQVIVIEKRPLSQHWIMLWNEVRDRRWGLVVDLRGSGLSGLLRRSKRAVYRSTGEREHKVIEAARLLKLETAPPAPFLFTGEATEWKAARLTAGDGPILAVAPAANWMGKAWPAERFAQIARRLLGAGGALEGGRVMVLGASRDRDAAASVKAAVVRNRLIDLVGADSLLVCYAALKRARIFIGNDSGLMHLAAAAGAPTLGLFGPSDETRYAPWGEAARALRGPRPFEDFLAIDPTLSNSVCHMTDLSTAAVLAAAETLIADTAPETVDA
ncbi:MAG TPA: glycosyltransferase family 9 protein [Caulobacteraceae bacterium]|jgi:ADP-heptose:LPS heptosyltransferase|nr:glycosyltransferase family 9 protein [Caulobacteraceae bacterium]